MLLKLPLLILSILMLVAYSFNLVASIQESTQFLCFSQKRQHESAPSFIQDLGKTQVQYNLL